MSLMSELVTIPDVPIARTGIEYQLASGPATFTSEDLYAAVAAQDDPAIRPPRIKLGHHPDDAPTITDEDGSTPAIGRLANLRVSDEGQTLYADMEGVPAWLASIMPVAFPNRSLEGRAGFQSGTRLHRLVIFDLALLGVSWPGVSTLDDLAELFSAGGPTWAQPYAAGTPDLVATGAMPATRTLTGRVDLEQVRRDYYAQPDLDWSMWIVEQYVDPPELIVQDDNSGELYRVEYTASGDSVTFADPVQVRRDYVDVAARAAATAGAVRARVFTAGTRESSRRTSNSPTTQEATMALPTAVRERLIEVYGLEATATDEQIEQAAQAAAPPTQVGVNLPEGNPLPAQGPGDGGDTPATPAAPAPVEAPAGATPEPVAAAAGVVTLDSQAWQDTQAELEQGRAERAERLEAERITYVDSLVAGGYIAPARREHWLERLERDPGEREVLEQMQASGPVYPVAETPGAGRTPRPDATTSEELADDPAHQDYMARFGPKRTAAAGVRIIRQ